MVNTLCAGTLRTATARLSALDLDEAIELIRSVSTSADGNEWLAIQLLLATTYPGVAARLGVSLPAPHPHGSLVVRATRTLAGTLTCLPDHQAERLLDEATAAGDTPAALHALLALVYADAMDTAARWCGHVDRDHSTAIRALVALRQGDTGAAIELAGRSGNAADWSEDLGLLLATLVEAHTTAGNHQAAAEELSRPIKPDLLQTRAGLHYLYARGRHHLATGRPHSALADFLACGDRMVRWGIDTPSLAPWRTGAAQAWLGIGARADAVALTEEQLARIGAADLPRTYGITLRCLAAVRPVGDRPAILERAVEALLHSGDRYESARALADLTEVYRTLGDPGKANTAARRAQRITSNRHGTTRSGALPGASLSSSERRVASLAAAGYSNPEIAARLRITGSTVEQHLTRVYRKLRVTRRDELPLAFD
jgi:DNA-binding CsgD family transcriptional regulator